MRRRPSVDASTLAISVLPTPASPSRNSGRPILSARKSTVASDGWEIKRAAGGSWGVAWMVGVGDRGVGSKAPTLYPARAGFALQKPKGWPVPGDRGWGGEWVGRGAPPNPPAAATAR